MPRIAVLALVFLCAGVAVPKAKDYYNYYIRFRTCVEIAKMQNTGLTTESPEAVCTRVLNDKIDLDD
jgi:hypothetical protein